MRAVPFIEYVWARVIRDTRRDNYLYDCLWAAATDMRFKDKKGKATLARWAEINKPKREEKKPVYTKEALKKHFMRLKGK
jgi:hypothetical protein